MNKNVATALFWAEKVWGARPGADYWIQNDLAMTDIRAIQNAWIKHIKGSRAMTDDELSGGQYKYGVIWEENQKQ